MDGMSSFMDAGFVRGLGTVTLLLSFVALFVWAWSPGQRRRFEEASLLPFLDADDAAHVRETARRRR